MIASNGVKACDTVSNNLVDVDVGVDYVVNKQNDVGVNTMSDVSVELSKSVHNRDDGINDLVDVCVSVSDTLKDAYAGVKKISMLLWMIVLRTKFWKVVLMGLNKCVTDPYDDDNDVETKTVCVDKFVTNTVTDDDVGVHTSKVCL